MYQPPAWTVDPTRILTRRELATVIADLKRASRYANTRRNLVIVRLACCRGLRVSEIAALQFDDVVVDVPRAHLRLRRETTKGKRLRYVTLWWGGGTLADLVAWNPVGSGVTLGHVS
jgi:integrase